MCVRVRAQSMVSGEVMKVNTKGVTSVDFRWTAPVFLAGNELPDWNDNSGSIARRIITFPFSKCVAVKDASLNSAIRADVPAMIIKGNRAYRERHGGTMRALVVPPHLVAAVACAVAGNSSLHLFLASDIVERGEGFSMPLRDLRMALVAFEREMRFSKNMCSSLSIKPAGAFGEMMLSGVGLTVSGATVLGIRFAQGNGTAVGMF